MCPGQDELVSSTCVYQSVHHPCVQLLCANILDDVPWPGRGGVPQVRPGLEAAISILLCPPTTLVCTNNVCTTLVHSSCVPILCGAHLMLKKGSVPPQVSPGLEGAICVQLCPRSKCAQMCHLSTSRLCSWWTLASVTADANI